MKFVVLGLTVAAGFLVLTAYSSTRSVAAKPLHPVFLTQGANLSK
jgi:hypothetical protein